MNFLLFLKTILNQHIQSNKEHDTSSTKKQGRSVILNFEEELFLTLVR